MNGIFYDAFVQHFIVECSMEPFEVDISGWKFLKPEKEHVRSICYFAANSFHNEYPETFWVKMPTTNEFTFDGDYIIAAVIKPLPEYPGAYDDRDTVQVGIESALREIRDTRKSESRYDTVKAIHDYICANASYRDQDNPSDEQQCIAHMH